MTVVLSFKTIEKLSILVRLGRKSLPMDVKGVGCNN